MTPKPRAGEAVPFISEEIDGYIDVFEDVGASWYVIGGSKIIDPVLTFELPTVGKLKGAPLAEEYKAAVFAMYDFAAAFARSEEVRKATIEHALSIGAYYTEIGNHRPVVSDGRTVQ